MAVQYVDKVGDLVSNLPEPYNISSSNDQLSLNIDGGGTQIFTLSHGSTQTAANIVSNLSSLSGATASVCQTANGAKYVRIRTTSANGATSTINVNAPSNNCNTALGLIQTTYTGGANISYTFHANTRQNVINGVQTALTNAGWIVISGGGTSNCLMQSACTPEQQNLRMRVRLKDNSGTYTDINIENIAGTKVSTNSTSGGGKLLPGAGKAITVIANKYQAWCLVKGSVANGNFCAWGIPFIPSFMETKTFDCMWMNWNGLGPNDPCVSFRTCLTTGCGNNGGWPSGNTVLYNDNFWETWGNPGAFAGGCLNLAALNTANLGVPDYDYAMEWPDNTMFSWDPILIWGTGGHTERPFFRGQLWDAVCVSDILTPDVALSLFDSRNWTPITYNNWGNNQGSNPQNGTRGTLCVVTP